MPDLGFRDPDQMDKPIRIAQISFANENSKIIDWLTKRGNAIKFDKFDKVSKINAEIIKNLKSPDKKRTCGFCYKKNPKVCSNNHKMEICRPTRCSVKITDKQQP